MIDPMQAAVDHLMSCHGVTEDEARAAITDAMRPSLDVTWRPINGRDNGDTVQLERVGGDLSPPIAWDDAGATARELQRRGPDRIREFGESRRMSARGPDAPTPDIRFTFKAK